jgi:hypothetical protein
MHKVALVVPQEQIGVPYSVFSGSQPQQLWALARHALAGAFEMRDFVFGE